jgi:hypothetical protein
MNTITRITLLGLLCATLLAANTIAEDNGEPQEPVANENKKESKKDNKKEKDVIFKPSEEISEDLSVPFPTDI